MKGKLSAGLMLFGGLSLYAFAQNASSDLQQQLIGADRGIWSAIAGPHPNIEEVSKRLAPDYEDIDSGVRNSRTDVIQYLRGLSSFSFEYGVSQAYVLSPTSGYVIAVLTYSSVQKGVSSTGKVLTTTVFSKVRGQWMAHLHTEMNLNPKIK